MTQKTSILLFLAPALALAATDAPMAGQYHDISARLVGAALSSDAGLDRLEYLCDRIGNRVSGSAALEKAVIWAEEAMKRAGLENVRTIRVKVPHWVRGHEALTMLEPVARPIAMLGLGNSVGTPSGGVEAEVVTVSDFAQLSKLGREKLAGKIVLYNAPFESYGATVMYRSSGASQAARLGAVAALVRSITPFSLRSPHTGSLGYEDGIPKIPAAAVSVEDAEAMARLAHAGVKVRVKLTMEARMEPDAADSADIMGEVRGRERPEEVVVLGGHIDSWDIGQGAQDDGGGIMAALEAASLIKQLNVRPRRTVRVVFWTNEENGGAGGRAYRQWLGDAVKTHVAAIEMDGGAERPVGFGFGGGEGGGRQRRRPPGSAAVAPRETAAAPSEAAFQRVVGIGKLLEGINAGQMSHGGGGSDIAPLRGAGVPGFGLWTVGAHCFDWHHSNADTFDKVDPHDFKLCTAALAVLSYVLADMPERLSDLK